MSNRSAEIDAAYAAAQASGSGAIIVRGKLVDEPVAKRARDLIAMAPPLIITHEEIDQLFDSIRAGLEKLWD